MRWLSHSCSEKASRSVPMLFQVCSTDLASTFRKSVLSLANTCSIGLRPGLYGDRNIRLAPAARMARRTAWLLWLPRLSNITMSPGLRVGTRYCSTHARKLTPLIGPSKTNGAQSPSQTPLDCRSHASGRSIGWPSMLQRKNAWPPYDGSCRSEQRRQSAPANLSNMDDP